MTLHVQSDLEVSLIEWLNQMKGWKSHMKYNHYITMTQILSK